MNRLIVGLILGIGYLSIGALVLWLIVIVFKHSDRKESGPGIGMYLVYYYFWPILIALFILTYPPYYAWRRINYLFEVQDDEK